MKTKQELHLNRLDTVRPDYGHASCDPHLAAYLHNRDTLQEYSPATCEKETAEPRVSICRSSERPAVFDRAVGIRSINRTEFVLRSGAGVHVPDGVMPT